VTQPSPLPIKSMKLQSILAPVLLAFAAGALPAGAAIFNWEWAGVNLEVPDAPYFGDPTTVSDTRTIRTGYLPGLTQVEDISVWVQVVGSDGAGGSGTMWNGDLSVRLSHESGVSVVLMNRVGRTATNPYGSPGSGIDVRFDGAALDDVHVSAGSGALSGTFQADGRSANPSLVGAFSPRDATLADAIGAFLSVNGTPDGQWTLSVTDLESGGLARVAAWGMTVSAVPEHDSTLLVAAGALAGVVLLRERRRRR
jgi:hypothetical protein